MGICNSSTDKPKTKQIQSNLDFESYRDKFKEQNKPKVYELRVDLIEFQPYKKDKLLPVQKCKYLFIDINGKINSIVYPPLGSEITFSGILHENGLMELTSNQLNIETKTNNTKNYNGKLSLSKSNRLQFDGIVDNDVAYQVSVYGNLWKGSYKIKDRIHEFNCVLNYDNETFTGISVDTRGVSLWLGFEQTDNKVSIIQEYIDKEIQIGSDKEENNIFSINGVYDKINKQIEGTISNPRLDKGTKVILKQII